MWPGHPRPYADELFSSWLARLASSNGLPVRHFLTAIGQGPSWERDPDVTASTPLLRTLAEGTGQSIEALRTLTLAPLAGPQETPGVSGDVSWILQMDPGYRRRRRHGLQACLRCLKEATWFKKQWRCAYVVACSLHDQILVDRCHACQKPIRVWQLGGEKQGGILSISRRCFTCKVDLTDTAPVSIQERSLWNYSCEIEGMVTSGRAIAESPWCRRLGESIRAIRRDDVLRKVSARVPFERCSLAARLTIIRTLLQTKK